MAARRNGAGGAAARRTREGTPGAAGRPGVPDARTAIGAIAKWPGGGEVRGDALSGVSGSVVPPGRAGNIRPSEAAAPYAAPGRRNDAGAGPAASGWPGT